MNKTPSFARRPAHDCNNDGNNLSDQRPALSPRPPGATRKLWSEKGKQRACCASVLRFKCIFQCLCLSTKEEEKSKQRRYRGVRAISTSGVGKLTSHIRSHCSSALPSAAIFKVVHFINVCLTRNAPKQQIRNCRAALHSTLREFFTPGKLKGREQGSSFGWLLMEMWV